MGTNTINPPGLEVAIMDLPRAWCMFDFTEVLPRWSLWTTIKRFLGETKNKSWSTLQKSIFCLISTNITRPHTLKGKARGRHCDHINFRGVSSWRKPNTSNTSKRDKDDLPDPSQFHGLIRICLLNTQHDVKDNLVGDTPNVISLNRPYAPAFRACCSKCFQTSRCGKRLMKLDWLRFTARIYSQFKRQKKIKPREWLWRFCSLIHFNYGRVGFSYEMRGRYVAWYPDYKTLDWMVGFVVIE